MVKLFVVGFPRDMNEIELMELFSVHGVVDTLTIVRDQATNVSKGYGFMHMADQAGADRAIAALDGFTIDERQLSVRIADDKQAASSASAAPKAPSQQFQKASKNFDPHKKKRPRRQQ
ncbi:MAG: RNA-binding protein [Sphingobacteriaceae bacterium]|nr:MAG: RNA-binding protein [Sphingobacteriaceae bacterium]